MTNTYDALIVGTGQSGKPLAFDLAEAGWDVGVVEKGNVGGSCINYGCTPTKAMVASARVAFLARQSEKFGVRTGSVQSDMQMIVERKESIVSQFRDGAERALERNDNIDLIRGHAQFRDNRTVFVEGDEERELRSPQIFINTGQVARIPDIDGLESIPYLTNRSVMELQEVPEHLIVVGGGYIGLEFGQMFRRFDSEVTILQRGSQIAPHEDPDIAEELRHILEQDGVEVRLNTEAEQVQQTDEGLSVTVSTNGGNQSLSGSHLLLAAGRVPNTADLGLEQTDVETGDGGEIQVNDRLETAAEGIYALGDVKGGPAFTHISYDDYRVVRANLLDEAERTIQHRMVPYTIFTDPELGRIGLNEKRAQREEKEYRVASLPMERVARAIESGETRGKMKVLVDPASDRILGASILGTSGGEIASMLQIAMMGDLEYQALRDGIFSHPTLAESLNNLFTSLS